jgi:hypothetical protein
MLQNFTAKKVALLIIGIALAVGSFLGVFLGLAVGGRDHWATATAGGTLEFKRDYVCFGSGRGGPRSTLLSVGPFNGRVLQAEIFLSGFSFWYTGSADNELHNLAVDSWVERVGVAGPDKPNPERYVEAKILIDLRDGNPGSSDDNHQACVGYTIIALTQP